jgi:hypothetical protein
MRGISTVVTERCIKITPIHAVLLSDEPNEVSESSTNGVSGKLPGLGTAPSVKVVSFGILYLQAESVMLSALAGETKERVKRDETTKARDNIVFL